MANGNVAVDLGPSESESSIMNPQSNAEVYAGSMANILYQNRGLYVNCEFLIGTSNLISKEGILFDSGINYLSIYDQANDSYVVCDFFSLKFITFYPSRTNYLPHPSVQPRLAQQGSNMGNNQSPFGTPQMNSGGGMRMGRMPRV